MQPRQFSINHRTTQCQYRRSLGYNGLMPLLLLSARPSIQSNARLVEAGEAAGIEMRLLDATSLVASIGRTGLELFKDTLPISGKAEGSSVLARVGNWRPESMLALLEAACVAGMTSLNPAQSIRCARDHWQTLERVTRVGLPIPRSLAGMDPKAMADTAGRLLAFPLVVKLRRSRMGVGVMRADSRDQLEGLLDSLWRLGEEFILQEFIPSEGRSLRLLVLRGEVLAAAQFEAASDEWRSNGAQGGRAIALNPSDAVKRMAIEAASSLGLGLAGVDLLVGPEGPLICEVNPTPGFLHLEEATGIDVASAIVRGAMTLS